ncbi:MAG: helix-turn-helix domain-containing protein [Flavobacteriales bacterium]|nr:helix-turn-helix domain-containing protein [Flavobacteriales bacterium]MCB9193039.1 helix-turn-helix domain-containing protein [Flavobacteriales bacterium]
MSNDQTVSSAQLVIDKFGGQSALAKALGKTQSTVQHWAKTGIIPARRHASILKAAGEKGIDLSPTDFLQGASVPVVDVPVPKATHSGELQLGGVGIPCYVLQDGTRIFALKGVVVGLIGTEGGQLGEYIKVSSLRPYLPEDLVPAEDGTIPALLKFDTGNASFAKYAQGVPVEKFLDICSAYSSALQDHLVPGSGTQLTERQQSIARQANAFLRACAKTGIIALVDEATGYQYERAQDALQLKMKLFLEEEMRAWEKTFPQELWNEFGRLTNWKGAAQQRPKWWGKLVNEMVYQYLDPDVYKWLREHAPKPRHGQNYHQWMSSQYGLKRLIEHIWQLVGMASACSTMPELRQRMAEKYGRVPVQLTLYLPPAQ